MRLWPPPYPDVLSATIRFSSSLQFPWFLPSGLLGLHLPQGFWFPPGLPFPLPTGLHIPPGFWFPLELPFSFPPGLHFPAGLMYHSGSSPQERRLPWYGSSNTMLISHWEKQCVIDRYANMDDETCLPELSSLHLHP